MNHILSKSPFADNERSPAHRRHFCVVAAPHLVGVVGGLHIMTDGRRYVGAAVVRRQVWRMLEGPGEQL